MGVFIGVSDERALKAIRSDISSWDAHGSRADVGSAIIDYSKLLSRNRSCEVRSILCPEEHNVCIPNRNTAIYLLEHMHSVVKPRLGSLLSHEGAFVYSTCAEVSQAYLRTACTG